MRGSSGTHAVPVTVRMLTRAARPAAALICLACVVGRADAQTPSPLPEWEYSAGVPFRSYFEPQPPKWQTAVGIGFSLQPDYDGASHYELVPAPSFDIRYYNLAFLSVGEGLGVNLLHGRNYRAGLAITYDLGRKLSNDLDVTAQRRVGPTAEIKAFGEYVIFPVALRLDIRQSMFGGYHGYVGDLGAYMPILGSREHRYVVFAGPSVTLASSGYMSQFFSVTPAQAATSGLPLYTAHGGLKEVEFGVNATWFFHDRWFFNGAAAVDRFMDDAAHSPYTAERVQGTVALTVGYLFGGPSP